MRKLLLAAGLFLPVFAFSQNTTAGEDPRDNKPKKDIYLGEVHGTLGLDAQYYNRDSVIGAPDIPEKFRMNGFLNIVYTLGNFSAGIRYEAYLPKPLQGFDPRYEGQGVPYYFASYKLGGLEVTAGSFYEQFGNGLIMRSYEERALGYDNAVNGFRVKYAPIDGVMLKGFVGKQRFFMEMSPGSLKGIDGEINFDQFIKKMSDKNVRFGIGGSFVSKYQDDQEIYNPDNQNQLLNLPLNVAAVSGRMNLGFWRFNIQSEYAYKFNDPNVTNRFIYRPGSAFFFSLGYSMKGLGITLQAKRIENMDFRADRGLTGLTPMINFVPPLNKQHTYALAATIYPYAVQTNGEMGFQADVVITTPKWFLKKYPTQINLNFSSVNGLDTTSTGDLQGYTSKPFGFGRQYFIDANIEISQKVSKSVKINIMYQYLFVDKNLVQGFGTNPREISAHVAVVDVSWKFLKKHNLRVELQTLQTPREMDHLSDRVNGSWLMGLIEYSFSPHLFITIMDQWSYDHPDPQYRIHYITGSIGYSIKSTRFSLTYGRQREGIVCIGGVCRQVPASNGLTFSIMSSF